MIRLLLLAQGAASRDTVVTVAARDGYDIVFLIAAIAVALMAFSGFLLAVLAFLGARKAAEAVDNLKDSIAEDPAIASLRKTATNVEEISQIVRTEAETLSHSVSNLSERVDQAADRIEERIEDFNAFVEVVQEEVEESFARGAAVAKGVRAGLGRLIRRRDEPRRPPPDDLP